MCKRVIAVYDFRSKQKYIYQTNKIQEIMGASEIIKNAFQQEICDYNKIDTYGWGQTESIPPFTLKGFQSALTEGKSGAVLYEGGGNIVIMFANKVEAIEFNKFFSCNLLEKAPGLTPMCKMAEVDDLEKKSFLDVMEEVYKSNEESNQISWPVLNANVLPFTQIDSKTSLPVVNKQDGSYSSESLEKRKAFRGIENDAEGGKYAKHLDQIVEKKGKESLMAIIYIDGNQLGQYVKDFVPPETLFEDGVTKRRELASEINDVFVRRTMKAIIKHIEEVPQEKKEAEQESQAHLIAMRRIVGAGDEIAIICNARNVLTILKSYFNEIKESDFSACAGVVICHSHAPYSKVYAIAEECCQSGKERRRNFSGEKDKEKNSYVDVYFCRSAITGSLDDLRAKVKNGYSQMPYCINGCDEPERMFNDNFIRIGNELKKISRTKVKALRDAAFKSRAEFEMMLLQIKSNCSKVININTEDLVTFCDASEFYDIWFREEGSNV